MSVITDIKDQIVKLPTKDRQRAVDTYSRLKKLIDLDDNAALLAFALFGMEIEAACVSVTTQACINPDQAVSSLGTLLQ